MIHKNSNFKFFSISLIMSARDRAVEGVLLVYTVYYDLTVVAASRWVSGV